jgi:hypothetical protein
MSPGQSFDFGSAIGLRREAIKKRSARAQAVVHPLIDSTPRVRGLHRRHGFTRDIARTFIRSI